MFRLILQLYTAYCTVVSEWSSTRSGRARRAIQLWRRGRRQRWLAAPFAVQRSEYSYLSRLVCRQRSEYTTYHGFMPSGHGAELLITARPAARSSATTPTPTSTTPRWDGRLTGWQGSDMSPHGPNYSIVYSSPHRRSTRTIPPHQRTSRYEWKPLVFEERLSEPGAAMSDAASVCALPPSHQPVGLGLVAPHYEVFMSRNPPDPPLPCGQAEV